MPDRITPYRKGGDIRERIDEIVAENATVHFEMMDFDHAYLCITSGGVMRRYWFGVKNRSLVLNLYEECEPGLANAGGDMVLVPREPTPEMICAAWALVRNRWPTGKFLGVGPAFKECMEAMIEAALANQHGET